MSDEYIRKADIIDIPLPDKSKRYYITYNHDGIYEQGYQEALDKAASLPYADVVPVVHGKWLPTNDENKKRCNKCDTVILIAMYPMGNANYCPNCGAKMDAQGEE